MSDIPGFKGAEARFLSPPERTLPEGADERMERLVENVMMLRAEHLEMYAAAFLKEVGCRQASAYVLVERREGTEVRWSFERK